jgi:hypothetical protein
MGGCPTLAHAKKRNRRSLHSATPDLLYQPNSEAARTLLHFAVIDRLCLHTANNLYPERAPDKQKFLP